MKRITKNKKELTMSEYGTRASILTSTITINFLNKHQLDKIIPYLTENSYNFEFESEFTGSNLEYKLHIYDISGGLQCHTLIQAIREIRLRGKLTMKITTTQHIRIEFEDGSVKELSEQDAKELHSELGKFLSKSYNEKDYPIMEWGKDWKTPNVFGPDPNIIYYYNQPTAQLLNEMFTNKNVLKDAYDAWLKADISSFNWKEDTVSFTKIPTDLNVEVKAVDKSVVTKVGYVAADRMPSTLSIRVDSFRGKYLNEVQDFRAKEVLRLKSEGMSNTEIWLSIGMDKSVVGRVIEGKNKKPIMAFISQI